MATFRQTTSRADDPQIHTHAVISAKVQTPDGRWLALDARYLKRHQRMLGGLYQSVLRAELTHRFGVEWRADRQRAGRDRRRPRRAARRVLEAHRRHRPRARRQARRLPRSGRAGSRHGGNAPRSTREASADTRSRKSGHGAADLTTRWQTEAADAGWTADLLDAEHRRRRRHVTAIRSDPLVDRRGDRGGVASSGRRGPGPMCCRRSATCNAPCPSNRDTAGPRPWSGRPTTSSPSSSTSTRPATRSGAASDGRSVWIEPTAPRFTSEPVLAQEEAIITWAMAAQADDRRTRPPPSTATGSIRCRPTPPPRSPAATGWCWSSARPGPARPACSPPPPPISNAHGRVGVRGGADREGGPDVRARHRHAGRHGRQAPPRVAPRTDRPPRPSSSMPAGGDAGRGRGRHVVHARPAPARSSRRPERRWRLALVGDPRQLQGVGRGGLLAELCANGRVEQLERLHRFTHAWEAAASLQLRSGDPAPSTPTRRHGRIVAGTLDEHLDRHRRDLDRPPRTPGAAIAVVASTQRPRRHHQPRHPTRPPHRRPPRRRPLRHGSPAANTPTSATSWRPAATTAASSPAAVNRSATATPGPSPPSTPTASITVTHRRRTRRRHPPRRLRPRARPARLRRDRARLAVRHRRHRHRPRLTSRPPAAASTSPPPAAATPTIVCVVTDSHDIAEAATSSRRPRRRPRRHPRRHHPPRPRPTRPHPHDSTRPLSRSRTGSPPTSTDARHALADAHQHRDRLEHNVRDADADLAAAQRRLAAIDRDTSPARDLLAHAKTRTQHARWEQDRLQRELAAARAGNAASSATNSPPPPDNSTPPPNTCNASKRPPHPTSTPTAKLSASATAPSAAATRHATPSTSTDASPSTTPPNNDSKHSPPGTPGPPDNPSSPNDSMPPTPCSSARPKPSNSRPNGPPNPPSQPSAPSRSDTPHS